ncbi:MAG TPA: glycosyltransferase family 2 protein [Longimicrobiales bacterium]|nr:glycosyltransferase family 2 protein [Longimicrobiales bacterium]
MTDDRGADGSAGFRPIRMLDADVGAPLGDISGLDGFDRARILVRMRGVPVGFVDVPVRDGTCLADDIRAAVRDGGLHTDAGTPAEPDGPWPPLTVAVCTRGRPDDLAACLEHIARLDYPDIECIVVDNAPTDDANAAVCARHPGVRRVVEPRPGLNRARNRAILEAHGDIIAFADDDVRVDRDWAMQLARAFMADPAVMVVAGLGVPLELETPAQLAFEEYGGAGGGFRRIRMQGGPDWGVRGLWHYARMAMQGSGGNMAFRRPVFDDVGLFDPALDVGTPTEAGGDTEMMFRVLAHGHAMVYEPRAVNRHRHRRTWAELERQIHGWGTGMYAFLTRSALSRPRGWWVFGLLALHGYASLAGALFHPGGVPRRLILAQLRGGVVGPLRYFQARSRARRPDPRQRPQPGSLAP